jgi:hypothetical protein
MMGERLIVNRLFVVTDLDLPLSRRAVASRL